jgi:hypothetical protein
MPTEIHRKLKGEMNLVQDAVILGTLLDCFAFENVLFFDKSRLPKGLTSVGRPLPSNEWDLVSKELRDYRRKEQHTSLAVNNIHIPRL